MRHDLKIGYASLSHIGTFWIVFLFTTLYFGSHFVVNIGVKITPTDIAILVGFTFLLIINQFKFEIDKNVSLLFILFLVNFLVEMLSVTIIDLGDTENITLGVAIIRNAILVFLVSQIKYDYKMVCKWIVITGIVFSIIGIVGYIKSLLNYAEIVSNPDLWQPHLFYTLDMGILRLQGLREDPNFFFLVNLIPLFLSISMIREKKSLFSILMFAIILIASLLTFSRTGIILLGLLFLIIIFQKLNFKKMLLFLIVIILLMVVSIILNAYDIPNLYDIFIYRFEKGIETGGSYRMELWKTAWSGFQESIIFGKGGRYVLRKAGNYTHNDYLEMLSSHGIIGFGFMIILYVFILLLIKAKYKLFKKNDLFTSSSYLFIFMLVASIFFTIYYNPFIWFPVAFIFSEGTKHG